jgi:photosystem II stability/assembly factor-like uncharacterized protein
MRFKHVSSMFTALMLVFAPALSRAADNTPHGISWTESSANERRTWSITGPWGGDVRSLVCSPDNSDLFYLGTSDGQVFRSTNGAQSWERLSGLDRAGLSIDCIVIDPRNTKTIYVGAWAVGRSKEGGVFRSEDGGETWKLLEATKGFSVRSLAIAPSDSNLLITGNANEDPKLNGAFRSTDRGKKWERITPEADKEIHNIESVAIDPTDTSVIYVGTYHLPWKTTDAGGTWKQTGYKATGMIDDSDIFGISVNANNARLVYMNACSGIYRSESAGEKWFKLPGIPFEARRTYTLLPHPANPNVIFAGTSEGLWRSKDGGMKWALLTSRTAVIRSIVITADKPDRVLIGTDGFGVQVSNNLGNDFSLSNTGFIHRHVLAIKPDVAEHGRVLASVFHDGPSGSVFASSDDGETWQLSSRGLGTREVYSFYQVPDNPDTIYAGTNSGVYRSTDRGSSWASVSVPQAKPKPPAKKPTRSVRGHRAGSSTTMTGSTQYTAVSASKKRPASRAVAQRTKKKPAAKPPAAPTTPGLADLAKQVDEITGFVDSDGRQGLLAAAIDGLYRTFDETKGWEKVTIGEYDPAGRVYALSTHKADPKTIYAGTRQGLFISHDGGATWDHVDRGPSDMSVKAIAQDPRNPNLIIVGTNRFVYRSTNGGRSWVLRGGGLAVGDYTSVSFNPANPDEVMVADYERGGVFRSADKGATWDRIDTGLPSSRIWTLAFDPYEKDRIFAGSFSSGVYVLKIDHPQNVGK